MSLNAYKMHQNKCLNNTSRHIVHEKKNANLIWQLCVFLNLFRGMGSFTTIPVHIQYLVTFFRSQLNAIPKMEFGCVFFYVILDDFGVFHIEPSELVHI